MANTPRLISGKVKQQLPDGSFDFLSLSDTEKYLGLPSGNNYVLTSTIDGTRSWQPPVDPGEATIGATGPTGPIGYTGSAGSTVGGGTRYVNLVMSGEIVPPVAGTARFYPPESLILNKIHASISSQTSNGDFIFRLNKNGINTGANLVIPEGSFNMTPVTTNITVNTGDYLTLDVIGVGSRDLHVKIEYELSV